jgi:hypothetical protein
MLAGMETPGTAGPWLVLGLVLGALLPVLGALVVTTLRRRGRGGPDPDTSPAASAGAAAAPVDDLPGFLESPPGSAPAAGATDTGWVLLATPPPAAAAPPARDPAPRNRSGSTGALVGMAVAALLLIAAAAAVATGRDRDPGSDAARATREPSSTGTTPGPVAADLVFGSVVLDRHVVGVTVAVPRVRLTAADGRAAAEVELATFNCLRDEAPSDPAAAGCVRSVTEHAELSGPDLDLWFDGAAVRVAGDAATHRRRNGAPPVATGRVYELSLVAAPRDGSARDGRQPATGVLEIGDVRVRTRDDGASTITYGG